MRRAAFFKNENEYKPEMKNYKINLNGVLEDQTSHLDADEMKLAESRDAQYILRKELKDRKTQQELMDNLHFLDAPKNNKHVLFLDDNDLEKHSKGPTPPGSKVKSKKKKLEDFNVASHLDTHEAMLEHKSNRLTLKQLERAKVCEETEEMVTEKRGKYRMLVALENRATQLRRARETVELSTNLREEKTKKKKVKDADGDLPAQYVWQYNRKR